MSARQTNIYIAKLPDFFKSYNHALHRMIGKRPSDVREKDEDRIWTKLYVINLHRPRNPSVVGKIARISKQKGLFEKRYMPNWSEEHFHIKSWIPKWKPVFKIADDLGEDLTGLF